MPEEELRQAEQVENEFQVLFSLLVERMDSNETLTEYNFTGIQFPSISLRQRVFTKPVSFRETICSDYADFFGVTFEEPVDFYEAKFYGLATFSMAKFKGDTSFWETALFGGSSFSGASFSERPAFWDSQFAGIANFNDVTFNKGAKFINVSFNNGCKFSRAIFFGETVFEGRSDQPFFGGLAEYDYLKLQKDASFLFDNVNLDEASFAGTNLELINFRNVKWYASKTRPRRKSALRDEFRPEGEGRTYTHIAENYAQLVINYEKKRDYEIAEDFHFGEMEMRKKAYESHPSNRVRRWLRRINSYAFYRLVSNYGINYWKALRWLLFLIVITSFAFLFTGFSSSERVIRYKLFSIDFNNLGQFFSDFWKALGLTLSVFTLQRQRPYDPSGNLSHIIVAISSLLLAGQAALVFLAIRRKFKR